jgi:hypothetical protein
VGATQGQTELEKPKVLESYVKRLKKSPLPLCVAGRERVEENNTTEKKRGPIQIYIFLRRCASILL